MNIELHAKKDGLWLHIDGLPSGRSAAINLDNDRYRCGGIVDAVLDEAFNVIEKRGRAARRTMPEPPE